MNTNFNNSGLETSFRTAARAALSSALNEITSNWDKALSGNDVEAVHDLRVGTRRLGAALSIYEAVMPPEAFTRAEKAVSELTDIFGPARDADVLIEHLDQTAEKYAKDGEADSVGVKHLADFIRKDRNAIQKRLDKALSAFNLDELKADIEFAGLATKEGI